MATLGALKASPTRHDLLTTLTTFLSLLSSGPPPAHTQLEEACHIWNSQMYFIAVRISNVARTLSHGIPTSSPPLSSALSSSEGLAPNPMDQVFHTLRSLSASQTELDVLVRYGMANSVPSRILALAPLLEACLDDDTVDAPGDAETECMASIFAAVEAAAGEGNVRSVMWGFLKLGVLWRGCADDADPSVVAFVESAKTMVWENRGAFGPALLTSVQALFVFVEETELMDAGMVEWVLQCFAFMSEAGYVTGRTVSVLMRIADSAMPNCVPVGVLDLLLPMADVSAKLMSAVLIAVEMFVEGQVLDAEGEARIASWVATWAERVVVPEDNPHQIQIRPEVLANMPLSHEIDGTPVPSLQHLAARSLLQSQEKVMDAVAQMEGGEYFPPVALEVCREYVVGCRHRGTLFGAPCGAQAVASVMLLQAASKNFALPGGDALGGLPEVDRLRERMGVYPDILRSDLGLLVSNSLMDGMPCSHEASEAVETLVYVLDGIRVAAEAMVDEQRLVRLSASAAGPGMSRMDVANALLHKLRWKWEDDVSVMAGVIGDVLGADVWMLPPDAMIVEYVPEGLVQGLLSVLLKLLESTAVEADEAAGIPAMCMMFGMRNVIPWISDVLLAGAHLFGSNRSALFELVSRGTSTVSAWASVVETDPLLMPDLPESLCAGVSTLAELLTSMLQTGVFDDPSILLDPAMELATSAQKAYKSLSKWHGADPTPGPLHELGDVLGTDLVSMVGDILMVFSNSSDLHLDPECKAQLLAIVKFIDTSNLVVDDTILQWITSLV